jgi:hypothetical protein
LKIASDEEELELPKELPDEAALLETRFEINVPFMVRDTLLTVILDHRLEKTSSKPCVKLWRPRTSPVEESSACYTVYFNDKEISGIFELLSCDLALHRRSGSTK